VPEIESLTEIAGPSGPNKTLKLLRALAREIVNPPPVWLMRQAGRHLPEYRALRAKTANFLEFCYSPDLAIEASLQPVRRYGLDAAILFSDILVVPDALGRQVGFMAGEGPKLDPLRPGDALAPFDEDRFHGHLTPVYSTVMGLRTALPEEVALIGFAGAPWTVATYMVEGGGSRDFQKTRRWAYTDLGGFQRLIDLLVESTASYLIRQIEAGVQAVQIFDTWAGILPPDQFRRWVIEPTAEIVRRVRKAYPKIPIIGFPRGCGQNYIAYAFETEVDCLSLDATVSASWAVRAIPERCALQGNLDNLALLAGGAALERSCCEILQTFGTRPFVFNLGHGILPETPPEHVEKLIELIRGT
jgi:uroporphyrinogen decarboxylase